MSERFRPRGILLDMDGTLTEPMLDFPRIKADMGIGSRPILEALAEMPDERRRKANEILLNHEKHAAENSRLNPGCRELLDFLAARKIATAIITRNSALSADTVVRKHGLKIDALVTRDDGVFKPDPRPLEIACARLSLHAPEVWMVGDGEYDVQAGNAAGILTVWLSHGRAPFPSADPSRTVENLFDLLDLVREAVSID